jgi:hypothetical protein
MTTLNISRRELLAGAGAGAAALLLEQSGVQAQATPSRTIVFAHTTVVNVDAVQDDVALAIQGDKIVAIGDTGALLSAHPNAEVYDGRGKALFPGLINCHAQWQRSWRAGSTKTSVSPTPRASPFSPPVSFGGRRTR